MRLKLVQTRGLGKDAITEIPAVAVIVGPTGSGKSLLLTAIEIAVTGRAVGPIWSRVPQTNDGIMLFAQGKSLAVDLSGDSPEIGAWSVRRSFEERLSKPRRGEQPRLIVESEATQSFVPARTSTEHSAAIAEYLSTVDGLWDIRRLTAATSGELRKAFLGQLLQGGDLRQWMPDDLPRELQGHADLAPEPWIRKMLEIARKHAKDHETEAKQAVAVVEACDVGGIERDITDLERERDRLVADFANLDRYHVRLQSRGIAQRELDEATSVLEGFDGPTTSDTADDLARLLARAEQRDKAESDLARISGVSTAVRPTDEEISEARRLADAESQAESLQAEIQIRIDTATKERDRLRRQYEEMQAECEVAAESLCPHCQRPIHAEEAERLSGQIAKIKTAGKLAADDLRALESQRRPVSTTARDALRELEARLGASRDRERSESLRHEIYELAGPTVAELRVRQRALRDYLEAGRRVERARSLLHGLAIGEPVYGDLESIRSQLERVKTEIRVAQDRNADVRKRRRAAMDAAQSANWAQHWRDWIDRLTRLQGEMLRSCLDLIERPLRDLTGLNVSIALETERGAEDFRFLIGGHGSSHTLSGGESVLFAAGLLGAVYQVTPPEKARWRPLILDRIESVSYDEREKLIGRTQEYVRSGVFGQAILSGCPDTLPKAVRRPIIFGGEP